MRPRLFSRRAVVVVLAAAGAVGGAAADAAPVPPGTGDAQVIAQGVVSFSAGPHRWRLTTDDMSDAPLAIDLGSPTFLVGGRTSFDAEPVRVTEPQGLGWLLNDGEATFRPAGSTVSIEPAAGALVHQIAIDAGDGDGAFEPGAGLRDVDLVRDVLAVGESITVRSEVSLFVFVTSGFATVSDGSQLPTGATLASVGETTVTNEGDSPVVLLAAIIGAPIVDAAIPPSAPDDEPTPTTSAPTTSAPTTPPTTIDPTLETDGDGLTDVEEIEIYGTNPNNYDTDGDTVSDYLEAKDGYSDPFNPDTDGDGFGDSEVFDGYDPKDPNSYPGAPAPASTPTTAAAPPTSGP